MSRQNGDNAELMDTSESNEGKVDFDNFSKDGFRVASAGIRTSNALPIGGDWNFYKLNESFNKIMGDESNRLLRLMNDILKKYNINDNIKSRSLTEKVELIIEGNDTILERVGDNIDEMNGIKKKIVQPVEIQTVSSSLPINGAWNRRSNNNMLKSKNVNLPAEKINPPMAVHLLTGKNIIRPQTFFKDKIDNSNSYPWQPRITEKPNSIRPLALYLEETEYGDACCHPYEVELDQFKPQREQLVRQNNLSFPKPIEETPMYEIDTDEQLHDLVETLRSHKVIAVDLEHHAYRSFMGITCLMQISTVDADYLIDTLKLRDKLYVLNEIFTRPTIVKVFHGAEFDIQWLQRDLRLYVVNMFDTHIAAKYLGYSGLSLAYLLHRFCKFEPNKHFQLADWRIRPLPEELKVYARQDTHYLIYIYYLMKNELLQHGRSADNLLRSVIHQSTEVCKKRYFKPILMDDSHLDFYRKCKRLFDNRQLYALKHLYNWRDKTAREEDESLPYVLPSHMLLQIAELLPKEMQGILACCNPIPPLVRSNLLELHQIILRAREQPVVKPIMKEDNRSVGSTQQLSKINVSSPLHCPHDFTKQAEFRDDLPTLLNNPGHRDLQHRREKPKLEMSKSKYSAFNLVGSDLEVENVRKFSLNIRSPYERYKLVRPFVESEEAKMKVKEEVNTVMKTKEESA